MTPTQVLEQIQPFYRTMLDVINSELKQIRSFSSVCGFAWIAPQTQYEHSIVLFDLA